MNIFKLSFIALILSSLSTFAAPIFKSKETIKVKVDKKLLTCEFVEEYAHAGSIVIPKGMLHIEKLSGTKFKHTDFTGQAYLSTDFSCDPINDIIANADANGNVSAVKTVEVYELKYQNTRNGPITQIVTRENVRLSFSNGIYLHSTKSKVVKY